MVNQELKDYVSAQLKAGVTKEGVKKALLEAGWYEAEVQEALQAAGAAPAPTATKDIVQPQASPSQPKTISFGSAPAEQKPAFTVKPMAAAMPPALPASAAPAVKTSGSSPSKWILAGVVVVVLAAAGVLYAKNSTLDSQVGSLDAENENLKTQLAAVAKDKDELASEAAFLKEERGSLDTQLSILLPRKTGEETVSVRGSVGATSRGIYTITTDRGLTVSIKNSTDAKVASILKEIIGAVITVSGPHVAGTREITITAVNGMPLVSGATSPTSQ